MHKILFLFFIIILFVSCGEANKGIAEFQLDDNSDMTITLLFSYKNVQMYRFIDNDKYHYFAIKDKDVLPVLSTVAVRQGKTVVIKDDSLIVPE